MTSRPGAWAASYRARSAGPDSPCLVELLDLVYPAQVERFVDAWFVGDADRGRAVIREIKERPGLRRAAVVPLLLTFLCTLAAARSPDQPLPERRRDIYDSLVRRLLVGRWAANPAPDIEYCLGVLAQWAWYAVSSRTTPTGLGNWGETFVEPDSVDSTQERAIDHVAPRLDDDGEGRITRRFVHRTVQEHLVAEYLSSLTADDLAETVLPHLWFDSDWSVAAPAAIAAHNRHHPGQIFRTLDWYNEHPATDPAHQAARDEFDKFLLAVAEESVPSEWLPEEAGSLAAIRLRNATRYPDVIRTTADWAESNPATRRAVLGAFSDASARGLPRLVEALLFLGSTRADRADARDAVLGVMPQAAPYQVPDLVRSLRDLVLEDEERADAIAAILAVLPDALPWAADGLLAVLATLVSTKEDQAATRAAVLAALPHADPTVVQDLARALLSLIQTDEERASTRAAVLAALPSAEMWHAYDLARILPALVVTEQELAVAREAVLSILPSGNRDVVRALAEILPALAITDEAKTEASASRTCRRTSRPPRELRFGRLRATAVPIAELCEGHSILGRAKPPTLQMVAVQDQDLTLR